MFKLEDTHFWFVGKRYFIDAFLAPYKKNIRSVLDLGSGTGGATKYLTKYGDVTGVEEYDYAVKLAKKRNLHILKGDLNNLRLKPDSYDLVTILDVLYHRNVKDERYVLKKVRTVLKKNRYILITDSAFNFLKSGHDTATQGRRRYKLSEMINILETSGFKIVRSSYIYFSLFVLVIIKRFVLNKFLKKDSSDVVPVPETINKLLLKVLLVESYLLQHISLPIGTSIIILAQKR